MKYLSLFILLLLSIFTFAQFNISGTVVDNMQLPIESAEIKILDQDSLALLSTFSNAEGKFNLSIENGNYFIQIDDFFHAPYFQPITVGSNLNLGIIDLRESKELTGVVVSSKKPLVERKVDRLVFNVENSVAATGGNALDALKLTPRIKCKMMKFL